MTDVRLTMMIDRNVPRAVDFDAGAVESETDRRRNRADGEKRVTSVNGAAVDALDHNPFVSTSSTRRASTLHEAHTGVKKVGLERGRDLRVLCRKYLLARDDQRHGRAERPEHMNELDTGYSGADHDQLTRNRRRRIGLARDQDPLTVDICPIGNPRS